MISHIMSFFFSKINLMVFFFYDNKAKINQYKQV